MAGALERQGKNQDAIKILAVVIGPESKLQWRWPQSLRWFCGFLYQHGAS